MAHNPERGHVCPRCKVSMICTIEDGYCAVGGEESNLCDSCLSDSYMRAARRDDYEDY